MYREIKKFRLKCSECGRESAIETEWYRQYNGEANLDQNHLDTFGWKRTETRQGGCGMTGYTRVTDHDVCPDCASSKKGA